MVHELRPPILEREGLLGALQERLDAVEKRSGVEARLFVEDPEDVLAQRRLPPAIEKELYGIALEALNNALKHAAAAAVQVRLEARAQQVSLEVSDNGRGFAPGAIPHPGGQGLESMRERAALVGSALTLVAAPGQGVKVRVQVSLTAPEQGHPAPAP